ncbi:protein NKG7 [Marmota monax]|uniref:Protein NKG7 n=1 Tax=Marmota monax TaxID=9995 RepID=A0A834QKJ1_MARMO|nr:protein NKG7 [Marmota monax]
MEPCRSLALLAGSLGLIASLVALSTDFWFVAMGPTSSAHSGLWPSGHWETVAALSLVVAMAVYTGERWAQPQHPQIQTFFSWSFYLGWVSAILWLCAGALSLGAHRGAQQPGYESL